LPYVSQVYDILYPNRLVGTHSAYNKGKADHNKTKEGMNMKSTYEIGKAMEAGIISPLDGWRAMRLIVSAMSQRERAEDLQSVEWCLWVAGQIKP